jgi:hypothetical protein
MALWCFRHPPTARLFVQMYFTWPAYVDLGIALIALSDNI